MTDKELQKAIDLKAHFRIDSFIVVEPVDTQGLMNAPDGFRITLLPVLGVECSQHLLVKTDSAKELKAAISTWTPKAFANAAEIFQNRLAANCMEIKGTHGLYEKTNIQIPFEL